MSRLLIQEKVRNFEVLQNPLKKPFYYKIIYYNCIYYHYVSSNKKLLNQWQLNPGLPYPDNCQWIITARGSTDHGRWTYVPHAVSALFTAIPPVCKQKAECAGALRRCMG